ncbi:MAG TPA: porin family protein [Gammaproteobacteria bacterium]|nr:porin family protein [Gammaproteobacteria bacterium]
MKPGTVCHKSRTLYGVFALSVLSLFSSMSAYAGSDIIVTRPGNMSSNMSSNIYIGASLGNAKYDKANDSSAAFGIFGGVHINEILAVDFGWADLGEASEGTYKAKVNVLQVALLGKLHASTDFSLFGKVGLARWAYGLSTPSFSGSDDDINVYFGVGADYHISGRSAVRFGADFYNMKPTISNVTLAEENISLFSIGYIFQL